RGLDRARGQIALRGVHELGPAAGRAEVVGAALVGGGVLGLVRIDVHPAHRVLGHAGGRGGRACTVAVAMAMLGVRVGVVLCAHVASLPLGGIRALDLYTPTGYMSSMQPTAKTSCLRR